MTLRHLPGHYEITYSTECEFLVRRLQYGHGDQSYVGVGRLHQRPAGAAVAVDSAAGVAVVIITAAAALYLVQWRRLGGAVVQGVHRICAGVHCYCCFSA